VRKGAVWAVIGSGPSLVRADVEAAERAGCRTIAVNTACRMVDRPDLLFARDFAWWAAHEAETRAFERWTGSKRAASRWDLNHVETAPGAGLSAGGEIREHGNSGAQAIQLAVRRGAARVLLLGFDHRPAADGRRHWHGDHPAGLNNAPETAMALWRASAPALALDLDRLGVEVINCSRETALACWPRLPIEAALEAARAA